MGQTLVKDESSYLAQTPYFEKLIQDGMSAKIAEELDRSFKSGKLTYADLNSGVRRALQAATKEQIPRFIKKFRSLEHLTSESIMEAAQSVGIWDDVKIVYNKKPDGDTFGPRWHVLDEIIDENNYPLEFHKNRRKYGPPPDWKGPPPGPSCQVICENIPEEIFEDELILLFQLCGSLYELSLEMNPLTGLNRGYALITYQKAEDADRAVTKINKSEIRPGAALKISKVLSKSIIVLNISKKNTVFIVLNKIPHASAGLKSLHLYQNALSTNNFAIFTYQTEENALGAVKIINQQTDYKANLAGANLTDEVHKCEKSNLYRQCSCILEMLEKISNLKAEIKRIEKLCDMEKIKNAGDECFSDYVHHTLAIEGVPTDPINKDKIAQMSHYATSLIEKKKITVNNVRNMHRKLNACEEKTSNGRFRTGEEYVGVYFYGSYDPTTPPKDILDEMNDLEYMLNLFMDWTDENLAVVFTKNEVIRAAVIALKFVIVHPFLDGNGRISRLLFNLVLQKSDYPWITFPVENTTEYFESIRQTKNGNDFTLFFSFASKMVEQSLHRYKEFLERGLDA